MIKELKELLIDISNINTSVDMDDIRMVSALNENVVKRILLVRDFLGDLDIPKHEVRDVSVMSPNMSTYPELMELGLSAEVIDRCKAMYDARKTQKQKMNFIVMMKCCVFVHNYVIDHGEKTDDGYTINRLEVNKPLKDYLEEIDSSNTYHGANIYDFLTTKNFGNIVTQFFKCGGSELKVHG